MATQVEVQSATSVQPVELVHDAAQVGTREFVRFTLLERWLHVCMVVSFISLAVTGMSLKFSYTSWAVKLSHLLGGFQTAVFIHRTAAVIMFGTFATHLYGL